jgi:hypothetical protein
MNYKHIKEKSEFYYLRVIETELELNKLFDFISKNNNFIWRGINNSKYANYTSLQRQNLKTKELNSIDDVIQYIDKLDKYFDEWNNKLFTRYFNNYNIKEIPIFSKLSILRHHGVPTPLLDWSRNPNIALYFATELNNEKPDYISLYCITDDHPYYNFNFKVGIREVVTKYETYRSRLQVQLDYMSKHCDQVLLDEFEKKFYKEFCQHAFTQKTYVYNNIKLLPIERIDDLDDDDFKLYINNNYNITVQEGLFILNADPYLPLEKAIFERVNIITNEEHKKVEGLQRCKENFLCFDISRQLVRVIVEYLNQIGIHKETVYPDLSRLKKEIKNGR